MAGAARRDVQGSGSELKALGTGEVAVVRRDDLVVAAVALAACAVAFALTFRFSATSPAAMMSGMGAEFFPRLVIAVIALLAVCIAFGIGNPPMEKPAPFPRACGSRLAFLPPSSPQWS